MDDRVFALAFPICFAAMWLAVTTLLGILSGWFELQRRYPRQRERELLTLRMRSGMMGVGVHLNGILTLSACTSGLKVAVWPIFGVFQRPFVVPWNEIQSEPVMRFFQPMSKLTFGNPVAGRLTVDRRSWERLLSAGAGQAVEGIQRSGIEVVGEHAIARGFLLQWIVLTAAATAFFYCASRLQGASPHVPLAICFGFPAVVIGLSQLVRYAVQRRG